MPNKTKVDMITTRMKLKDVYPDLVGEFEDDAEFIRKGITPSDIQIKDDERAIVSYITTAAIDRDQEIVLPSGADLKDYRKNPVVLFGHNYSSLPIGKNLWIKSDDKGLIAKTQYANHEEADKVYNYRKDGFPLAESIGFIPIKTFYKKWSDGSLKWDEGDLRILEQDYDLTAKQVKNARAVYVKWTMLEYSDVAVPSNQEALELMKSKGLIPVKKDQIIVHDKSCECEACANSRINLENKKAVNKGDLGEIYNLMKELSEEISNIKTLFKKKEIVEDLKQHEKDYYSFSFEDDSEELDIDYKGITKAETKKAIKEHNDSLLAGISDITTTVFDTLSGKVVQQDT